MQRILRRGVNESVSSVSRVFGDFVAMTIVCECGRPGCDERVKIMRADFEAARAAGHYVVARAHRSAGLVEVALPSELEARIWE